MQILILKIDNLKIPDIPALDEYKKTARHIMPGKLSVF